MVDRADGRKISEFIANGTVADSDLFTFVSSGTNYRITKAQLKTALGINGSTMPYGIAYMQDNVTNTVIAAPDTPVLIAGTWLSGPVNDFSVSGAGRLTYTGSEAKVLSVDFVANLFPVSGNKNLYVQLAKNGTLIAGTIIATRVSSSGRESINTAWSLSMAENDYVEAFVGNEDDGTDILVSSAILRMT
jgi:hypothetical protein